jgi:hypothetical protein
MSLNWNISEVENYQQLCWVPTGEVDEDGKELKRLSGVTDALIWLTMMVDLGSITEKNYRDFALRVRMYESIFGPMLRDRPITTKDVKDHIGLRTNVAPTTWAKFLFRMRDLLFEKIDEDIRDMEEE